jgi:hypothetical protein
LGVDSVSDLQRSDRAIIDLLTTEWLRILEHPKVRGHETRTVGSERVSAVIHPVWERVRNLFFFYFTGRDVVVCWGKNESVVCDPVALELQALGCLSKVLAYSFGEQDGEESSVQLGIGWVERVGNRLHEKLTNTVLLSRCKSGVEFGYSPEVMDRDEMDYRNQVSSLGQSKISRVVREVVTS